MKNGSLLQLQIVNEWAGTQGSLRCWLPVLIPVWLKCWGCWHGQSHISTWPGASLTFWVRCGNARVPWCWGSNCLKSVSNSSWWNISQVCHARFILQVATQSFHSNHLSRTKYLLSTVTMKEGFSYGFGWELCFCEINISHSRLRLSA